MSHIISSLIKTIILAKLTVNLDECHVVPFFEGKL